MGPRHHRLFLLLVLVKLILINTTKAEWELKCPLIETDSSDEYDPNSPLQRCSDLYKNIYFILIIYV